MTPLKYSDYGPALWEETGRNSVYYRFLNKLNFRHKLLLQCHIYYYNTFLFSLYRMKATLMKAVRQGRVVRTKVPPAAEVPVDLLVRLALR